MKKDRVLTLMVGIFMVLVLVAMPFVASYAKPSSTSKPIILRVAEHSPSVGIRAEGLKFLADKVEKETDGRVKLQIYWSDTLIKEKEMMLGCKRGSASMVVVMTQKFQKELPHWLAFNTLMSGPGYRTQVDMWYKAMDEIPELIEDFAKQNQKVVGFHAIPYRVHYMTTSVSSLWDIKGKTVRVNSEAYATLQKAAGALPVFMPMSECYMAMERGTIDGVFTSFEAAYRFKFYEVGKTLLLHKTIWPGGVNILSINRDTFNKISPADQEALLAAGRKMSYYFADLNDRDMDMMMSDIRKAGVTIVDTPAADIEKWVNDPSVVAISDKWVKKTGRPDVMKKVKKIVAEALKK